jgi:cupin superfamily acireductone dioxygenase involved in methionine salvage
LKREHRFEANGVTGYRVSDGGVYVDVRDSGDEWVRIALGKGDGLVLPNAVFR